VALLGLKTGRDTSLCYLLYRYREEIIYRRLNFPNQSQLNVS
jgi:hypothetical protein